MNAIPKPEFPRPERERSDWMNLNGQWEFRLFAAGQETGERAFAENRSAYDRTIRVPFSWASPLSGVEEDVPGVGWYRRTASFQSAARVFLCLGAVDYLADVYINGTHAGQHRGGYAYFEIDVTPLWLPGDNLIELRAEDNRRETQPYGKQGYGEIQGIWQTVWLESRPGAYIRDFRVTTRCDGCVEIAVDAHAPDGAAVTAAFGAESGSAVVRDGKALLTLGVHSPRLWSPDDPYLYQGELRLACDGDTDTVSTYFGIREISAARVDGRGYRWILLNGKPIYLNGTLDQAFHPQGHFTYPTDADMYKEAWRLKRLGLNMVRIHIKAEEPRKLYWMDKLGVLVMADIPCFWGPPVSQAREAYEHELPQLIARDINHPSIFAWVVFNESWGLLDKDSQGQKFYAPDTQEWVRAMYRRAKALDPTRLVEDNSACRYDHVETDLNTWHFYLNSYEVVRDHIRRVVENTYPGSEFNFIGGNRQTDAPLMNSECGMVWGVDDSAGDSDLAWQYHYMLNEYRLHEKLCGFIFTEFHDVVNEFNGYYRIDDMDKDFGYRDFCRGMTLRDLHAADFIAVDCAPVRTAEAGQAMAIPLVLSSFTDARHGKACSLRWELWHDGLCGRVTDAAGIVELPLFGYGTTKLEDLTVTMPGENAVAVLSLYLLDEKAAVISRNFTAFDVQAKQPDNLIEIPVCAGQRRGFAPVWTALADDKLCLGGEGEVSYDVRLPQGLAMVNDLVLHMEASSKRVLQRDRKQSGSGPDTDLGFMRGYRIDRGAFENSYWMTDESRCPAAVEVLVNDEVIRSLTLENDWADARGVLSWHRQKNHRKLDEAGSYGEEKHIPIPSRLVTGIVRDGGFTLILRVKAGGLALYGRNCGRYAHGLALEIL